MSEQDDRTFLKHFSMIIVGLIVFTILIIVLSLSLHRQLTVSQNPAGDAARVDRIQPVAGVYAGETGRAAAMAAREESAVATDRQVAFDGSLDAEMIYVQVCQVCHVTGAAGAPLMEPGAWGDRLDKSTEELVANAITGIGAMPPRGGRMDLSDEQVEVATEYMLDMVR